MWQVDFNHDHCKLTAESQGKQIFKNRLATGEVTGTNTVARF